MIGRVEDGVVVSQPRMFGFLWELTVLFIERF